MLVTFSDIAVGKNYSRPELANLWGYRSYHAIARGVVTPQDSNLTILFVTEEKQDFQVQYRDRLVGKELQWEGPDDHFAEERMIISKESTDQIHLFHRMRHHSDFTYLGQLLVGNYELFLNKPSRFVFGLE